MVEYRPGHLNIAADALSRRDSDDMALNVLYAPSFKLYDDLRREIAASPELSALCGDVANGSRDTQ